MRVLVLGCGYMGRRLARRWRDHGARVQGVVRSTDKAEHLERRGIEPVIADLDDPDTPARLKLRGALVYYLVQTRGPGPLDLRGRAFAASVSPGARPEKLVLVSTTGVYGDCGGRWVDEDTPVNPARDRSRRRLDGEQCFAAAGRRCSVPVTILRVGGIYGPGRLPRSRLEARTPMPDAAECPYTNLIHIDDLTEAAWRAGSIGSEHELLNVTDGHPVRMIEYFDRAADALGLPRLPVLPLEQARRELSPAMLEYLSESRRVDNRRMLERLGMTLIHPDCGSGLTASVRELHQ